MTCFSIQKSLISVLLAGFFISLTPLPAKAQETQPPQEEVDKLKAEDQRLKDEAIGKVDSPIVLELFTTADCTACVFSDRMLYDTMKNDKNVIGLSCKINDLSELYSYRGANLVGQTGEETKKQTGPMDPCVFRQWAYRSSYTNSETKITIPTFIFNGYDQAIGDDMQYFVSTLNAYHYISKNRTLEVFMRWKDKDTITIHLPEDPKAGKIKTSASVWVVRYKDMMVEKVESGMNKGRVLRFSNIIQNIKHIGKWHQQMRVLDIDVEPPQGGKDRGGYVVLVQEMMGEPVLAAGKLVDYPHPNDVKKLEQETGRTVDPERTTGGPIEKKPEPVKIEDIAKQAPRL